MKNLDYIEFDKIIKNRISLIVYDKKISLRKLSRELGHSESYMQKLLSKDSTLTLKAIVELCNYLDIEPAELLSLEQHVCIEYTNITNLLKEQSPDVLSRYYLALKCLLQD